MRNLIVLFFLGYAILAAAERPRILILPIDDSANAELSGYLKTQLEQLLFESRTLELVSGFFSEALTDRNWRNPSHKAAFQAERIAYLMEVRVANYEQKTETLPEGFVLQGIVTYNIRIQVRVFQATDFKLVFSEVLQGALEVPGAQNHSGKIHADVLKMMDDRIFHFGLKLNESFASIEAPVWPEVEKTSPDRLMETPSPEEADLKPDMPVSVVNADKHQAVLNVETPERLRILILMFAVVSGGVFLFFLKNFAAKKLKPKVYPKVPEHSMDDKFFKEPDLYSDKHALSFDSWNKVKKIDGLCYPCTWSGEHDRIFLKGILTESEKLGVEKVVIRPFEVILNRSFFDDIGKTYPESPRGYETNVVVNEDGHTEIRKQLSGISKRDLKKISLCLACNTSSDDPDEIVDHMWKVFNSFEDEYQKLIVGVGEIFYLKKNVSASKGQIFDIHKQTEHILALAPFLKALKLFLVVHLDAHDHHGDQINKFRHMNFMMDLLPKLKGIPVIWAHGGLASINPDLVPDPERVIAFWDTILDFPNVYIDLSWSAQYVLMKTGDKETIPNHAMGQFIAENSTRFVFGTDYVHYKSKGVSRYQKLVGDYYPFFRLMEKEARSNVLYRNMAELIQRSEKGIDLYQQGKGLDA